jgi:hypothetical protein
MLQTRRLALRLTAILAVAATGLIMTAGAVSAATPDPFIDPPQVRDQMLAAIEHGAPMGETHAPAAALAATHRNGKARTVPWTQSGIGANINQSGSMLVVASVKNSVDGDGAVVSTVTLNGNSGTDKATRYQANGVQNFEETFTLGAPDANGLIPYEGSGKCTGPGTGVHKNEKCSYTYSGSLDPTTNQVKFDITGTTTR